MPPKQRRTLIAALPDFSAKGPAAADAIRPRLKSFAPLPDFSAKELPHRAKILPSAAVRIFSDGKGGYE